MGGMVMITKGGGCGGNGKSSKDGVAAAAVGDHHHHHQLQQQLSLVSILLATLRKSMVLSCTIEKQDEVNYTVHDMEIGWPTNIQHVAHVTFDRFQGFLGLPVEFEVEIPPRVPSASVSVFGVSAESMQCSFDKRGNSVPTILLLMQERLYVQGGLQAEGIFRINPENSHEEHVRDQLNKGTVPDEIDVHYLAGLIKAWFRELPSGVLDGLSPEQVLQCNTEQEFVELVKQLKPMESALLHWAIDLMADVVEHEESNKMNARNIAMVFAPNMTQMSDPLTALMHAIQVMNLLKTLTMRTLREREVTAAGDNSPMSLHSSAQQIDEEFDRETVTSCESAGPVTDYEDPANYTQSSEDQDEVESLSDTRGRFFKQLAENEDARNDFRKKLEGILCKDHVSTGIGPVFIGEPCIALPDSDASSDLSTSEEEDPPETPVTTGLKVCVPEVCESTNNMDMTDNKSLITRGLSI